MIIYLFRAIQVPQKALITALWWNKILIEMSFKYVNFANILSANLTIKLFKIPGPNENIIDFVDDKLPLYKPIYLLSLVN